MDLQIAEPLLGGVLIGLGSFVAAATTGRIPGVSGVFSRIFSGKRGDTLWRVLFLLALVAGAGLMFSLYPPAARYSPKASLAAMVAAGVLVGFGTRLGGGCTSGHGVCGIGLGSRSALLATLVFMGSAIATVFLLENGGVR